MDAPCIRLARNAHGRRILLCLPVPDGRTQQGQGCIVVGRGHAASAAAGKASSGEGFPLPKIVMAWVFTLKPQSSISSACGATC